MFEVLPPDFNSANKIYDQFINFALNYFVRIWQLNEK